MNDLAFKGDVAALDALLSASPAGFVNTIDPTRRCSPLYTAARFGKLDVVKLLVGKFNALVDVANGDNGSTPLHGAAFGGHAEIVKFLLVHGANRKVRNLYKELPIDNAKHPSDDVSKSAAKATIDAFGALIAPLAIPVPGMPLAAAAAVAPVAAPQPAGELSSQSLQEVRAKAKALGLDSSGAKDVLVARIRAHLDAAAHPAAAPPAAAPQPAAPPADDSIADESPKKKLKPEATVTPASPPAAAPSPVAVAPPPPAAAAAGAGAAGGSLDPAWIEQLRLATATMTPVPLHCEDFWQLEEKVSAWNQGRNEDYVGNRLKKKKKPITFVLLNAWKVTNPVLEAAFAAKREAMIKECGGEEQLSRIRVAFHGTKDIHIPSIIKTSLLRFQHPLNPCTTQADDGYFGTNKKGVYVSRYYDYTLKYCNGLNPLEPGQTAKIIMFKALPGKTKKIDKLSMGIDPDTTGGFHSHSSPNNLEWYMFDERQLCPEYVLEMKAQEDTRTAADDE